MRVDFVTALLDFWDDPTHRSLTEGVGLLFFMPDILAGYRDAYANVEAFCRSQRVTPVQRSRDELISERDRVLQVGLRAPVTRRHLSPPCSPLSARLVLPSAPHTGCPALPAPRDGKW